MKYIVPTPDIKLYADGFETQKDGRKLDLLGRAAKGKQLSDLVERIEDPLVVAVDGRWGSGKSFFLKCWVGAHENENGGKARTVYYDAFEHDYLDDPLMSLTATIVERLEGTGGEPAAIEKIKKTVVWLARPAARIALALTSAGASEAAGPLMDAGIAAAKDEISAEVDGLWAREAGRRAAMEDFRKALISLTGPQDAPRKLVVVIDELDRCRPDHALCVLEVIKHFFDVPHVHFVLGVNLAELANSVRARYGAETDAGLYLQKFVTVTMALPEQTDPRYDGALASLGYFDHLVEQMGVDSDFALAVEDYLRRPPISHSISLRSIERLVTNMALMPLGKGGISKMSNGRLYLVAGLVVLKSCKPFLYAKAKAGTLEFEEVVKEFDLANLSENHDDPTKQHMQWAWAPSTDINSSLESAPAPRFWGYGELREPKALLKALFRSQLDVVTVLDGKDF